MPPAPTTFEERYKIARKVAGLGMGDVDYLRDTITLDPVAAEIFDLPAEVPIARAELHGRIHPADRDTIEHEVHRLLTPESAPSIDVQHRVQHRDGSLRWVAARKEVRFEPRQPDGLPRPVTGIVAIMDITSLKQAEEHSHLLLLEVRHRSKNLLTVVNAIARRTFGREASNDALKRFSARLAGLGRNLDALVSNNLDSVDLRTIATGQLSAFVHCEDNRLHLSGPKARFATDAAQGIGMAFHELATNAVKYGALSNDTGHIDLSWRYEGDTFVLRWVEQGGPPVSAPTRTGFGQTVICTIAGASVGGKAVIDYAPDGLVWTLSMPRSVVLS
ncbi:sensor histidine kinase [Thalassorhabdomicrobium marinisediminis]|uniref:sensor histidine kinase n=1 Tax=Thalassorhabdomicrobium marinisediminis TaxID=2170577 RepID=UPI002491544F|nr:HWE histidine kinase domain-containing protein [Thalassorhabdomicrobium marinisediminis]